MLPKNAHPQRLLAADCDHAASLAAFQAEQPGHEGAYLLECDTYFEQLIAAALERFPLSRVTGEFYDEMLNVLPPRYMRGSPGWFVCEAEVASVHAQFIEWKGHYYGGNADLRPSGKRWSIEDIIALEASNDTREPLTCFPASQ